LGKNVKQSVEYKNLRNIHLPSPYLERNKMQRRFGIAPLNLTINVEKHSPEIYKELFAKTFNERICVPIGNEHNALIGSLYHHSDENNVLYGEIFRYVNLNKGEAWFNTLNQKEADVKEVAKTISIPEWLKPHLRKTPFLFFLNEHKLFILSKGLTSKKNHQTTISPSFAKKIFESLFLENGIGTVNITPIPAQDTLEKIFSIPAIHQFTIETLRPNPDDNDAAEKAVVELMKRRRIDKDERKLHAEKNSSILLDDELKNSARIAQSNGFVEAKGKDENGHVVTHSTKDNPMILVGQFDEKQITHIQAVFNHAKEFLKNLKARK
jgi:hypothetical protein